jgi:hypothetical protein
VSGLPCGNINLVTLDHVALNHVALNHIALNHVIPIVARDLLLAS